MWKRFKSLNYKNVKPASSALMEKLRIGEKLRLNRITQGRDKDLARKLKGDGPNASPEASKEAFEKIYKKFREPILNYVSGKMSDRDSAEELTQEIFIKAYRFRESYDPRYELSTWLWTIARNTLADWHRKNGGTSLLQVESGKLSGGTEEIPSLSPDPELALVESNHQKQLLQMMSGLTELQKKALFMRLIHHLPYREIAKQLNMSRSAVKCLVYRAKTTLLRKLDEGTALALVQNRMLLSP